MYAYGRWVSVINDQFGASTDRRWVEILMILWSLPYFRFGTQVRYLIREQGLLLMSLLGALMVIHSQHSHREWCQSLSS